MKMQKCVSCRKYTLKKTCPQCGADTSTIRPPKYSPDDPYGKYRRMMKQQA